MKMYSPLPTKRKRKRKPIKIKLTLEEQKAIVLSKYKNGGKMI